MYTEVLIEAGQRTGVHVLWGVYSRHTTARARRCGDGSTPTNRRRQETPWVNAVVALMWDNQGLGDKPKGIPPEVSSSADILARYALPP